MKESIRCRSAGDDRLLRGKRTDDAKAESTVFSDFFLGSSLEMGRSSPDGGGIPPNRQRTPRTNPGRHYGFPQIMKTTKSGAGVARRSSNRPARDHSNVQGIGRCDTFRFRSVCRSGSRSAWSRRCSSRRSWCSGRRAPRSWRGSSGGRRPRVCSNVPATTSRLAAVRSSPERDRSRNFPRSRRATSSTASSRPRPRRCSRTTRASRVATGSWNDSGASSVPFA